MSVGVVTWSQTAATNATADTGVNWAEGQAPSTVNDSARGMMSSVAKWRDDLAGALTTGGTSTAYTLTTNQVFASLSAMSGQALRVKFDKTNAVNPTLNVDGLNAKAIVTVTGTAVPAGFIKANNVYDLVYANGSSEWIMAAGTAIASQFAAGTGIVFYQTAAPTGWTISVINDKALRVVSSTGGVVGGTTAFSTVFASRTISQANLPSANLTVTAGTITPSTHLGVVDTGQTASMGSGASTGYTTAAFSTIAVVAQTAALGGSGTALDFAVQYADCIICTKD